MIAGNIPGLTRTMPLAIYSAVSGGNMEQAYTYVLILVLISLVFVLFLSLVLEERRTSSARLYARKRRRAP